MRRVVFLLLLAVAATWAFFAWRAARAAPVPQTPVALDGAPVTSPRDAKPASTPTERSTAPLPPPASDGQAIDKRPVEDRGPDSPDDPLLAAQYAEWSKEQLEAQLMALELEYAKELDGACDARFAAHQYRVLDEQEIEGVDPSYDVLSAYDKEGVLTRVRTVALPGAPATDPASPASEMRVEHQLVSLPPESYPDLYRRRTELAWLRAKLATARDDEDPR